MKPNISKGKYEHKMISGTHDVENCWCMNISKEDEGVLALDKPSVRIKLKFRKGSR